MDKRVRYKFYMSGKEEIMYINVTKYDTEGTRIK